MKHISTTDAPPPGFYNQGILVDTNKFNLLFTAGQTGNDPYTDRVVAGIYGQTMMALSNLEAVIRSANGTIDGVIKINVYLKDVIYTKSSSYSITAGRKYDREAFAYAYEEFFRAHDMTKEKGNLPTRTFVWVSEIPLEIEDTLIEIDAVVAIPKE